MKFVFSIFSVLFLFSLAAQNTNPFEIPERATSVVPMLESEVDTTSASTEISTDSIEPDTEAQISETEISEGDTLVEMVAVTNIQSVVTDNPFEIGSSPQRIEETTSAQPTITPAERTSMFINQPDTKVIVLVYSLVMLIILTLAISIDRKKFGAIVKSCYNSNILKTLYRDTKAWTNGQSIILYVFFFFNFSFIIWFLNTKMNLFPEINLFMICGICLAIYLVRHVVMWSMSAIFPLGQEVGLYNYSVSTHNMVLGVFLLPFILALEFMPSLGYQTILYGVLAVVIVLYTMRQIKGLLLSFGIRGFNIFYFFVYLCAVEISPFLVAYKMISGAL